MSMQRRREGKLHDTMNKLHRHLGHAAHFLAEAKTTDVDLFKALIKRTCKLPPIQSLLLPHPFPISLVSSSQTENPLPFSGGLRGECILAAYSLQLAAPYISNFLQIQERYENSLFRGDFSACKDLLDEIQSTYGFSLWLMEARITLAYVTGGEVAVRRFAADHSPDWANTLLGSLITFHIYRTTLVIKPSEYNALIQFVLEPRGATPEDLVPSDYLKARILPYNDPEVQHRHLAVLLYLDHTHSAIDRYFGLLKALKFLLNDSGPSSRQLVGETINILPREIRTNSWLKSVPILTAISAVLPLSEKAREFRQCFALYFTGDFSECLARTEKSLVVYPNSFDFCELHVKALIKAGSAENPFLEPIGIQRQLLRWLYEFYSRGKEAALASVLLPVIARQHPDTQLSDRIGLFLAELALTCGSLPILSILGSVDPELDLPRFFSLGSPGLGVTPERKKLAKYIAYLPLTRTGLQSAEDEYSSRVLRSVITAAEALNAFISGEYGRSAELRQVLLDDPATDRLDRFEALKGRLRALMMAGDRRSVMRDIVDAYLADDRILDGLVLMPVADFAQTPDRAKNDINYPLALYLAARSGDAEIDPYRIHAALDDLLEANNVERPSQLRNVSHAYQADKLHLLLANVCVPEALAYSSVYKNTRDVEGERIEILSWLSDVRQEDRAAYREESHEILRAQAIRETIQHVHKSKIYVDTNSLRAAFLQTPEDLFQRIKSAHEFETSLANPGRLVQQVSFKFFNNTLNAMLADYIYDNAYGLDSYLSTRIRHGTLVGQLRSEFEKYGLVTRQTAGDSFQENRKWLDYLKICGVDDESVQTANVAFTAFSQTIYIIIEDARAHWIQIRGPEHPNGMFDFDFSEDDRVEIYLEAVNSETLEVFVDRIMAHFWKRACRCLTRIQDRIKGELRKNLIMAIDALERAILDVPAQRTRAFDLVNAIAACRTGVQVEVATVADWFTSDVRGDIRSFDLEMLVDACMTFISKISPDHYLEMEKSITPHLVNGDFLEHFFSIFSILIDNVFRHGSRTITQFQFNVDQHEDMLCITVKNHVPDGAQMATAAFSDSLSQRSPDCEDAIRQEGGSGFIKLHKLVRRDLARKRYSIETVAQDGIFTAILKMSMEGLIHANPDR